MIVEHKISYNELYYGYIWWNTKTRHIYQQLFPETGFSVFIGQREIKNRRADWKRFRAYLSKRMKRHYQPNDVIVISRNPEENVVRIWRKRQTAATDISN